MTPSIIFPTLVTAARRTYDAIIAVFSGSRGWSHRGGELFEQYGGNQGEYNPPPDLLHDVLMLMKRYTWEQMVNGARSIYATYPLVSGAVHDKSNQVVGTAWSPVYRGKNEEWGRRAEKWLKQWYKRCDERGSPYTFQRNLWIGSNQLEHSGDFLLIAKRTTIGPVFRFVESHRIGQRWPNGFIEGGEYAGAKSINGIVYGDANEVLAYRILGDTAVDDYYEPAANAIHVYDPIWYSQGRGIPTIAYGMNSWMRAKHIADNEQVAQDIYSRLTLIEQTATGRADPAQSRVAKQAQSDPTKPSVNVSMISRGEIRYVKANSGQGVQPFVAARPQEGFFRHYDMTLRGAFMGMSWPIEWAYDLQSLGGATMRAMTDKINRTVAMRQALLKSPATFMLAFALQYAIDEKQLPFDPDFLDWDFDLPADATVDDGADMQNDRDDINAGLSSPTAVLARRGRSFRSEVEQKAKDIAFVHEMAKKHKIDVMELRMLTPNGSSPAETGVPPAAPSAPKAKPKPKAEPESNELAELVSELRDTLEEIRSGTYTFDESKHKRIPKGVVVPGKYKPGQFTRKQAESVAAQVEKISAANRRSMKSVHWEAKWVPKFNKDGTPVWQKRTVGEGKKAKRVLALEKGKPVQARQDEGGWKLANGQRAPEHIQAIGKRDTWTNVKACLDLDAALVMTGEALDKHGKPSAVAQYSEAHTNAGALCRYAHVRALVEQEDAVMAENERNLKKETPTRENALALKLIHMTGIRPGSKDDGSYGCLTLEARHVTEDDKGRVHLKFLGKDMSPNHLTFPSGKDGKTPESHMGKVLKMRSDIISEEEGPKGKIFETTYADFSKYVPTLGKNAGFVAKNFRTLKATGMAWKKMKETAEPKTWTDFEAKVREVCEAVSKQLGHATKSGTMAFKSYIDPMVWTEWRAALPPREETKD